MQGTATIPPPTDHSPNHHSDLVIDSIIDLRLPALIHTTLENPTIGYRRLDKVIIIHRLALLEEAHPAFHTAISIPVTRKERAFWR